MQFGVKLLFNHFGYPLCDLLSMPNSYFVS